MAFTCGFFNAQNHDRTYNNEQMAEIFDGVIQDGVYAGIGKQFTTIAGTGMQVLVQSGRAWFDHTWSLNDAPYPLTIETADDTRGRIDAVVLETDHTDPVRANSLKVVKGTVSANPQKPPLLDTADVKQHALAYVTVPAGATSIASENVEINVGKTGCPFVTSVLQQTDITALFSQWNGQFHEWFDDVQAQLSGSVATNLQNQIDSLKFMTGEIPSATCSYIGIEEGTTMREFLKDMKDDIESKFDEEVRVKVYTKDGSWLKSKSLISATVILFGGGGGGAATSYSETISARGYGGGGGGGYYQTFSKSAKDLPDSCTITIGAAGGNSSNGGPSSFGNIASASGGGGASGKHGGSGGSGGGGGGGLSSESTPVSGGNGGRGHQFGGGGGGGGSNVKRNSSSSRYIFGGSGGAGGTIGGGGGGTGGNAGETTITPSAGPAGMHGGRGGVSGVSKSNQVSAGTNGANGTQLTDSNVAINGTGAPGKGGKSFYENSGTFGIYSACGGGGGGGGYGGNGGNAFKGNSESSSGGNSYAGGGGGGGGGYGGNGGNGASIQVAGSSSGGGGGGGGGYGASGVDENHGGGGGGGGYGIGKNVAEAPEIKNKSYGQGGSGGGQQTQPTMATSGIIVVFEKHITLKP